MIEVIWVLEDGVNEDRRLMDALQAHNVRALRYRPLTGTALPLDRDYNGPVVLHGGITFVKEMRRQTNWVFPNCDLSFEDFRCSRYWPKFSGHLLNEYYALIPQGAAIHQLGWLRDAFGDNLFVRPDRSDKPFDGCVVKHEDQMRFLCESHRSGVEPHELLLVSSAKRLMHEFRALVVGNQVVDGSFYREPAIGRYETFMESAQNLLDEGRWPHTNSVYTFDLAETQDSGIKLVEISDFTCAGLYEMDRNMVVASMNHLAFTVWAAKRDQG